MVCLVYRHDDLSTLVRPGNFRSTHRGICVCLGKTGTIESSMQHQGGGHVARKT